MRTVTTRYGVLPVAGPVERHPSGALMSCVPAGPVVLATPIGPLRPQHSTDDVRRRTVQALHFYEDGSIRRLPLEEPALVPTPAGALPAELVTFHRSGALSRVFPLNGKLSGYWTQEDEGRLATPVTLDTPVGRITARIIGAGFYPDGRLRSVTLWPGETLDAPTPAGVLSVRNGLSFWPSGALRSVEPARPQAVATPVGPVQAYDLDACGVCGDENSLCFGPDGTVERCATNLTRLVAHGPHEAELVLAPASRESLCGDTERESVPMRLAFAPGEVTVWTAPAATPVHLSLADCEVRASAHVEPFARPLGRMGCQV